MKRIRVRDDERPTVAADWLCQDILRAVCGWQAAWCGIVDGSVVTGNDCLSLLKPGFSRMCRPSDYSEQWTWVMATFAASVHFVPQQRTHYTVKRISSRDAQWLKWARTHQIWVPGNHKIIALHSRAPNLLSSSWNYWQTCKFCVSFMIVCQVCESDPWRAGLRWVSCRAYSVVQIFDSKFLIESSSSLLIAQYSILFNSKCKKTLFAQH